MGQTHGDDMCMSQLSCASARCPDEYGNAGRHVDLRGAGVRDGGLLQLNEEQLL